MEDVSLRKTKGLSILCVSLSISLYTLSVMSFLPMASAQGSWENLLSISKTIEIPPGEEYFAYFDRDAGTIVEMMRPSPEAGLSQKAKDALSQVPNWLYEDLTKKFVELGDTTVDVGDFATPVFADMDADGDLDLSVGSQEGSIYYFENVGTGHSSIFVMDTEMYSYIDECLSGVTKTSLAPVDWDADGDQDLIIGNGDGGLYFFENFGTSTQAVWSSYDMISGYATSNSHPALADLDDDGDFDLAVGGGNGNINFYENVGTPESPEWDFSYSINTGEEDDRPVSFADMDDDGDFDLTVGDGDFATLYYYRNVGTSSSEFWAADATMYNGIAPEYGTSPAIADLNGDGRPDLVVGGFSGRSFYYRNIGTASNANWLIWSSYQVVEGYMYYPKEVLLDYRSDYWMDMYADLILNSAQKYKDEIGFAIAHTPTENLKAMNQNQTQLFVENAELIYEIDRYLDYVQVIEKEDYTTTRYKFGEPGNTIERELPRDIYYWFIVLPKITDENVFYIHPDDSDPNNPTDPEQGGRFWREYLFYHADESYPPDNSGSPDDGVDDYPQDVNPPLLKDVLSGITTLWNGTTHSAPGGRALDYGENALIRVSNWVGWTLVLNQQEVSDSERPIQPVRIAHHHNGNCGELQDLTTAAARTALIPAAGVLLLGEDHVWIEFYENGWHQWDNYWGHGGSVIDNFDNYWVGWGQRGGSGIWKHGGDDDAWEVTDHYIPEEDLNYVTIRVMDNNGDPVDGARILVFSYWLKITIEGYQIEIPFPCIWNYTDANGETLFKLATQTKSNGNHNFTFKIISKVGSTESGKLELEHGQDYTFSFFLEGSAPNPELNTNEQPNPDPPDPRYRLGVSYQVKKGTQHPRHLLTGNYHPEEIPPERLPEGPASDFRGNHIDSFVTDEPGFFEYMKGYNFDSYEYSQDSNSDAFEFDLPNDGTWYFVLSNRDSIETTKVVDLTLNLYYNPPPYSVKIIHPPNGSQVNIGDIVTISGIVTNGDELVSLQLSTDNGSNWVSLSWMNNNWTYSWDTSFAKPGLHTIEVIATFDSTQDSDSIEVELMDMEPPSVDILTPIEYSQINIGQTVTISGSAYDNIGITSLQLSTDGGNSWIDILSSSLSGQWSYKWITTGLDPGDYLIQIQASDGYNSVLNSRYVELLDMDSPYVSISDPTDGSKINLGTTVTITGEANDNRRVSSLQLSTDGGQNWTDILSSLNDDVWSYEWDTTGLALGMRSLMINASDGIYITTYSIDIELADMEGPSVSIVLPPENSQINIGSVITISGNAIDNVGIQRLRLSTNSGKTWVDILSSLINGQWSYNWDTKDCSPGMCTLKIKASDVYYQESDDYVFVELVDTVSPKLTISSPKQDENFNCGEIIAITGMATDNTDIEELKLSTDHGDTWIDILPSLNNGNWHYDWDTKGSIGGSYTITITTSDGVNPQKFATVEINLVDVDKPELKVTAPIGYYQYDVGDVIIIQGKASDNTQISGFWISTDYGKTWIDILPNLDDRGRWSYIWDTSDHEAGTYNVSIKLSDGTNQVEDTLTIELVEEEKEEEKGISLPSIWLLILITIALIVAVVVGAVIFKKHHRDEEVVVVEEMRP